MSAADGDLALVLTGGGARAAYQVGLLRHLAHHHPDLEIPILYGVSAGAINAAQLADRPGTFSEAVEELTRLWSDLTVDQVFRVDAWSLVGHVLKWGLQLALLGGFRSAPKMQGLLDTTPLEDLLRTVLRTEFDKLVGVQENLRRERLRAVAIATTNYATGQTVTWIQGRKVQTWERPKRRAVATTLSVQHVMASSALPAFFPAMALGNDYYGDGGIRLSAPLAPAVHLGARRILAISTRHGQSQREAEERVTSGYPPPAQVLGVLLNAIFLDVLDQDAQTLERINALARKLPEAEREGFREIELLVVRPSQDLGRLANEFEARLPLLFRFLTRRLGTRETRSQDLMSLLMFQGDYLRRLIELGEADAAARADEIAAFLRAAR